MAIFISWERKAFITEIKTMNRKATVCFVLLIQCKNMDRGEHYRNKKVRLKRETYQFLNFNNASAAVIYI